VLLLSLANINLNNICNPYESIPFSFSVPEEKERSVGGCRKVEGEGREPNGAITSLTPRIRGIHNHIDDHHREESEETQEVQEGKEEERGEDWAKIAHKRAPTETTRTTTNGTLEENLENFTNQINIIVFFLPTSQMDIDI